MIILFPKRKGVKIATTLILQAIDEGHSFQFILGMIDFASKFRAITPKEGGALIQYLNKSFEERKG